MNVFSNFPYVSLYVRDALATGTFSRRCNIRDKCRSLPIQNNRRIKKTGICTNHRHICFPVSIPSFVDDDVNMENRRQCIQFTISRWFWLILDSFHICFQDLLFKKSVNLVSFVTELSSNLQKNSTLSASNSKRQIMFRIRLYCSSVP